MMIEKIEQLKKTTSNNEVKSLCENAISTISSGIYNNIPQDAKYELEKAVITNLFEKLEKQEDNEIKEWLSNSKRVWAVQNLGVKETINKLLESEGKNNLALKETLQYYKDQVSEKPEVLLYESYISALQSFNYFPVVGNAIEAIKDRVDNYKNDVDISKVLETMKQTTSAYLVPIIEDLVNNYLENKTKQTKSSLKEGLIKFSYDPFVRDLINIVTIDAKELQLEHANAECDVEKVYSPILYLGENEAIFSIKNSYYIKKGNNVSVLNENIISKLDPEFKAVCEALNSNNIVIDEDEIRIYEGSDKAIISKNGIIINGESMDTKKFNDSVEVAEWTGKGKFLKLVEMFNSNFNEIAEIDFAKRVYLKENEDYAADIFKLRDNVSIATYNPNMGSGTFFRNINPIQAKNVMMEHLKYDVSSLFKGLLPNEKKILAEINETKEEYNNYIKHLENKINEVNSLPEYNTELNKNLIEILSEELTDVKNEFKDYLNEVEQYLKPVNEAQVTLDISGPLQIEVDGQKFTVPIPSSNNPAPQFQQGEVAAQQNLSTGDDSAITFDPTNAEATSDNPSMDADKIDMDADKIAADADAEDAEKSASGEEVGDEDVNKDDTFGDEGTEETGKGDDEGDDEDFSLNLDDIDKDEDKGDEGDIKVNDKKKKKKKKTEESSIKPTSKPSKTRKVYLKRKK